MLAGGPVNFSLFGFPRGATWLVGKRGVSVIVLPGDVALARRAGREIAPGFAPERKQDGGGRNAQPGDAERRDMREQQDGESRPEIVEHRAHQEIGVRRNPLAGAACDGGMIHAAKLNLDIGVYMPPCRI